MKTALITGAGIGLGKGSAEALAAAGYHVILTDVLPDEGSGAAEAIINAGGSAEYRDMDVTDSDAVNAVIGAVEAQHGPLTALVLNAGIAKTIPLDGMADQAWDLTQEINLKGMMRVLRAAAPQMRAAKQGAVVCLTSVVGPLLGWAEHIPYSASKGGVAGFVKAAALELAPDQIRVNAIAPGVIRTAQTLDPVHSLGEEGLTAFAPKVPLGRIGDPADIADVVVFLLSHQARFITGQTIAVDGGLTVSL